MSKAVPGVRYAEVDRETTETRIQVVLDVDGGTRRDISTGIGFFDHMLVQLAFYGEIDCGISVEGDLGIDDHHTIEDVGIVLGQALGQALDGDQAIVRYADCVTVMDEALVMVAIDIGGRSGLFFDVNFKREMLGEMATENVREFFRSLTSHGKFTLHIKQLAGDNDHHIAEAIFKGVGRALRQAAVVRSERRGTMSTKGSRD